MKSCWRRTLWFSSAKGQLPDSGVAVAMSGLKKPIKGGVTENKLKIKLKEDKTVSVRVNTERTKYKVSNHLACGENRNPAVLCISSQCSTRISS